MRTLSLCLSLFLLSAVHAQTYFYIDGIEVLPASPTTNDVVVVNIQGTLSSTGAYIENVSASIDGFDITIDIDAADTGGLTVLVPHVESVELGMLQAGEHTIIINGANVLDLAPPASHLFTVTEAGGDDCDQLEVVDISYHPFADTIEVRLANSGNGLFSYPGLILFDENGDTLAMETVDLFGIGEESYHVLAVHSGADPMEDPFNGTLEIWTGFYDSLACSFDLPVMLCPATECDTLFPYVMNLGGAIVNNTFAYSISMDDQVVAQGTIELSDEFQFMRDTLCLPPGNYTMEVTTTEGPGAPWAGVDAADGTSGPMVPVEGDNATLPFAFHAHCADIGTGITTEAHTGTGLQLLQDAERLIVIGGDGTGTMRMTVHDVRGAVVTSVNTTADRHVFHTGSWPAGVYLIDISDHHGNRTTLRSAVVR